MARRPRDPLDLHGHHIVTSDELHRAFDRDESERERARHRRRLLHGLVLIAGSVVVAAALVLVLAIGQGYRPFSAVASPSSAPPRPTVDAGGCPVVEVAPAPASGVQVNVFNATTTAGLAASVAGRFRDRGYAVGAVGNRTVEDREPVVVVAGPGGRGAALTVQRQLPGSVYREDKRPGAAVDVVVGTAFTRLADPPPADAAKAGRLRCAG